jgi:hypothetical protein
LVRERKEGSMKVLAAIALVSGLVAGPAVREARAEEMSEAEWRKVMDNVAAGADQSYLGQASLKDQFAKVARECGRPVRVTIDWKGFKYADWSKQPKSYRPSVAHKCAYEMLEALASMCGDPKYQSSKPGLAAIKTITCHYKPDAELPRATPPSVVLDTGSAVRPQSEKVPGREFRLGAKGTNIDVSFCEATDTKAGYNALGFLMKTFPPPAKP